MMHLKLQTRHKRHQSPTQCSHLTSRNDSCTLMIWSLLFRGLWCDKKKKYCYL